MPDNIRQFCKIILLRARLASISRKGSIADWVLQPFALVAMAIGLLIVAALVREGYVGNAVSSMSAVWPKFAEKLVGFNIPFIGD